MVGPVHCSRQQLPRHNQCSVCHRIEILELPSKRNVVLMGGADQLRGRAGDQFCAVIARGDVSTFRQHMVQPIPFKPLAPFMQTFYQFNGSASRAIYELLYPRKQRPSISLQLLQNSVRRRSTGECCRDRRCSKPKPM